MKAAEHTHTAKQTDTAHTEKESATEQLYEHIQFINTQCIALHCDALHTLKQHHF